MIQTLSTLQENRQKAFRKTLSELPPLNLFDPTCTDADAEALYALSWYAMEDRAGRRGAPVRLHTLEELKTRVLSCLAAEISLLSVEEHDLLIRTVLFGGRHDLTDPETLRPALSLVRRLWSRVEKENERLFLTIPPALRATSLLILAGEGHRQVRDAVQQVHDRIDTSLYLMGALALSAPEQHLAGLLKGTHAEKPSFLIRRFFHAGYNMVFSREGQPFLVHPGLDEPEKHLSVMAAQAADPSGFFAMDESALTAASDSLADLEDPLYERLLYLVLDVTRPEAVAEDVLEDLFLLAKQSASLKEMEEVLSESLICMPTEEMRAALRDLSARVPRWFFLSTGRLQ